MLRCCVAKYAKCIDASTPCSLQSVVLLGQELEMVGEYKCTTPQVCQQAMDISRRFYCSCHGSKHSLSVQFVPITWGANGVCVPMASEPADGDATSLEDLSFSVTDAIPELYKQSRSRSRRAITDKPTVDMDTSTTLEIEDSGNICVASP